MSLVMALYDNVCLLARRLIHNNGPDGTISANVRWIAMRLFTDIHGSQVMNPNKLVVYDLTSMYDQILVKLMTFLSASAVLCLLCLLVYTASMRN